MKTLLMGPVSKAVNGLWLSGLYAILTGCAAGTLCGAIVGFAVMVVWAITQHNVSMLIWALIGAFAGAFYGFFVGIIVGLPSGILASGLGGRQGCRIGTATIAFCFGSGIAYFCLRDSLGQTSAGWKHWSPLLIPLAVLLFTFVSYGIGNLMYNRLENSEGLFTRWRVALHESGVEELNRRGCMAALGVALVPVVFTYGYVVASLILRRLLF